MPSSGTDVDLFAHGTAARVAVDTALSVRRDGDRATFPAVGHFAPQSLRAPRGDRGAPWLRNVTVPQGQQARSDEVASAIIGASVPPAIPNAWRLRVGPTLTCSPTGQPRVSPSTPRCPSERTARSYSAVWDGIAPTMAAWRRIGWMTCGGTTIRLGRRIEPQSAQRPQRRMRSLRFKTDSTRCYRAIRIRTAVVPSSLSGSPARTSSPDVSLPSIVNRSSGRTVNHSGNWFSRG